LIYTNKARCIFIQYALRLQETNTIIIHFKLNKIKRG